jgi:hypothetical protein
MFHKQPHINETALKMQIDRLFARLDSIDNVASEEYRIVSARLQELYDKRKVDSEVNAKPRENLVAWAAVVGNLVTVAMIVDHERTAVITSKAIAFVQKLK